MAVTTMTMETEVYILGDGWTPIQHAQVRREILAFDEEKGVTTWKQLKNRGEYSFTDEIPYLVQSRENDYSYVTTAYSQVPINSDGCFESWSAQAIDLSGVVVGTPFFLRPKALERPSYHPVDITEIKGYGEKGEAKLEGKVYNLEIDAPMYVARQGDTIYGVIPQFE